METGIKEPKNLTPRVKWLRDYYFEGTDRKWNNENTSWTTGEDWDFQHNELTYYIVPETYPFLQTFRSSFSQTARKVELCENFREMSLPERIAWFNREVVVRYLPAEILPGDLIAGGRFNIQTSSCLSKKETRERDRRVYGKKGTRASMKWFHDHGYGNSGATSGHLIPGHKRLLKIGWKGVRQELDDFYGRLSEGEKKGRKGAQLRAMMTASTTAVDLAARYADLCGEMCRQEADPGRKRELEEMERILRKVPYNPPETFHEALQALWINHMLIMSDENYPGPGVSFGRLDQYLYPYWLKSESEGMDREYAKEILGCFWVHANTAYDALIKVGGNQGITAGYGQLLTLSGLGPDGEDKTNDLTYMILEVIDDLSPILEPKPNIRIHRNSPEKLMNIIVDMIMSSQGAPFLLNFDERSMAGMDEESKRGGIPELINRTNLAEYAPVGCLENTMVGNDRSGTVDNNLNLYKAVELVFGNGRDLFPYFDPMTGKYEKVRQDGPRTGDPLAFKAWDEFWGAYVKQTAYIVKKCVDLYEKSESLRADTAPTPYLSCLVQGCAEKGKDITEGGAEISFTTMEAVTYASTVDSLLAVKYLVFDKKVCTMAELIQALRDNWAGHEILQAKAKNKAPKFGVDDHDADRMGFDVMKIWTDEVWKHKTKSTGRQFRPGMLSWNYWVGDGFILPASPDGRPKGSFFSNAICPVTGMDVNGPTSNSNSVGKVLGGKTIVDGEEQYVNILPNGASHTISFNPSIFGTDDNREKFKAFLKGYARNGGTALQINMIDSETLKEAQKNPADYRHLLVRVTGYNAYFVSIGRELQDELIARLSHDKI
ncbi:MAG: hypothetical protein JXR86_19695 [Spirochaetales bacterium]|nr:hypothetical protein [Spirochaetales bacterium]